METLRANFTQLQKDIQLWYSRLQGRGRYIFYAAVVGLIWLVLQAIVNIATGSPILGGWPGLIINIIAGTLVALIVAQFVLMRRMQRDFEQNLRHSVTKGRRTGNRAEQIAGVRNKGSVRRGGGMNMNQALTMITQVSVEDLDKQYRPKPFSRPTLVESWQEIEDAGIYALESAPKAKIEIIDAKDVGGGFFVGKYSPDGIVKDRHIMTNRGTGEPLRFDSMRNAKKALSGGYKQGKRKVKPKRKRK